MGYLMDSKRRKRFLENLIRRQEGKCFWCNIEITRVVTPKHSPTPDNLATIDHLVTRFSPFRREDRSNETSSVMACNKCNILWNRFEQSMICYEDQVLASRNKKYFYRVLKEKFILPEKFLNQEVSI